MSDDNNLRDQGASETDGESGKAGWALLWLLGIPLPVLLVAYLLMRGC